MSAEVEVSLRPVMGRGPAPEWSGARWIGGVDVGDLPGLPERVALDGGAPYAAARVLLRDGLAPLGFVELDVRDGAVDVELLRDAATTATAMALPHAPPLPPMTVAVTTRNRPENIAALLACLGRLDYPEFEIVIVDNASADDATVEAVRASGEPRARVVREPRPGASRGRNTAVLEARYDIVAFVDDDIIADAGWLRGVATGFARAADVAIVTGMVPSGELITPAQAYFEARISWEIAGQARVFRLSDLPEDIPLFPFEVGAYGTGANFAVRRDAWIESGGMNEALGTGSPAGGGEDIDLFVRLLYGGHALVYEPASLVWHRHRRDLAALDKQVASYGRGFGAWVAAVLADRRMRADALRLVWTALRRTGAVGKTDAAVGEVDLPLDLAGLRRREVLGMLGGPFWYARSRFDRRAARPLAAR